MSQKKERKKEQKHKGSSLLCKWKHHLYIQALPIALDNTTECKGKLKYEYLQWIYIPLFHYWN